MSVGYRVRSKIGVLFCQWAIERLKSYLVKGFTIDSERLKGNGGGQYWYELLNTIKDIRCLAYKENIRRLYLIVLGGSPRRMICDSSNGNPEGTILGDADYWELYLHWGL